MKLSIHNFAMIKHADITIDGITVIAGENNTGKSTVGKVLFSLFNAVSDIEDRILDQRIIEVRNKIRLILENYISHDKKDMIRMPPASMMARRIANRIEKALHDSENIDGIKVNDIVAGSVRQYVSGKEEAEKLCDNVCNKIDEIFELPEETIALEFLSRYFGKMFYGQVNSLVEGETKAEVNLGIKGKSIELSFQNDRCIAYQSGLALRHKAVYIDNPFIVDRLDGWGDNGMTDQFLSDLLRSVQDQDIMDGIIEQVLAKEKLAEIEQKLNAVVNGQIVIKNEEEYYLKRDEFSKPVSVSNLSTGLKSFVILKLLIENGLIREKDVIVLDEPEIHLHPQWQVAYAELIVLLQKHFDLSVVVTTHSPYFLDAINLFSVKYGTDKNVNYYLSSVENEYASMEDVTENLDTIYKKMVSPLQMLETLRYELNHDQEA